MSKKLVVIAGNIGAGKTSLAERIGSRLGWRVDYESVSDNPYLPDFYADMRAWSFHLQIYFLGHRATQYLEAANDPRSAILDRSLQEDAYIFSRALHHMGNLAERDFISYQKLFALVTKALPTPNLLIYLKCPIEVLFERIHRRARNMETGISSEYLMLLDSFYNEWLDSFDLCPVLTIQTDDLDYVHQPMALEVVVERIRVKIGGKEELDLRGK